MCILLDWHVFSTYPPPPPRSWGKGLSLVRGLVMTLTPGTRMLDSLSAAAWPRQLTRNHVNQWTESDSDVTRPLMLICFCLLDFLPHPAFHAVKIYRIVSSGLTALVVWEIGGCGVFTFASLCSSLTRTFIMKHIC